MDIVTKKSPLVWSLTAALDEAISGCENARDLLHEREGSAALPPASALITLDQYEIEILLSILHVYLGFDPPAPPSPAQRRLATTLIAPLAHMLSRA